MLPTVLVLSSYLLGSIPFSYLVVRVLRKEDIRSLGSGNVGATNVTRSVGKVPGLIALILDIAKGWAAVMVAAQLITAAGWPFPSDSHSVLGTRTFWLGLAGFLAVVGHLFPVWLRFRGGKGVATAGGVFLAQSPMTLVFALILFLIVALISRYISLGSIVAAAAIPVFLRFVTNGSFWIVMFSIFISFVVILKHRTNLARLARGEERKFPS